MTRYYRSSRGVALVEVLLAVMVAAVGLTAVIEALLQNHRALRRAAAAQEAAVVLDNALFDLLRRRYVEPGVVVAQDSAAPPGFHTTMTAEDFTDDTDLLQRVRVEVSGTRGAQAVTLSMETLGLRRPSAAERAP